MVGQQRASTDAPGPRSAPPHRLRLLILKKNFNYAERSLVSRSACTQTGTPAELTGLRGQQTIGLWFGGQEGATTTCLTSAM